MLARHGSQDLAGLPHAPFTTMVHIRTFALTSETSDDHLDADQIASRFEGPMMSSWREHTICVVEENGEAIATLLTKAGIPFTHETSWVPDSEEWIAMYYEAPPRDQDEWE